MPSFDEIEEICSGVDEQCYFRFVDDEMFLDDRSAERYNHYAKHMDEEGFDDGVYEKIDTSHYIAKGVYCFSGLKNIPDFVDSGKYVYNTLAIFTGDHIGENFAKDGDVVIPKKIIAQIKVTYEEE
jgi:hypothetical protein